MMQLIVDMQRDLHEFKRGGCNPVPKIISNKREEKVKHFMFIVPVLTVLV